MSTPAITIDDPIEPAGIGEPMRQRQWKVLLGATLRQWRARIGLLIFVVMVVIALAGPLIAPHHPNEFVTAPNGPSTSQALFGGDNLGRDVWSRFLYGGRTVLGMSRASTIIGVGLGLTIGLAAAYFRGWIDEVLMRISDVFMAGLNGIETAIRMKALLPCLHVFLLSGEPATAELLERYNAAGHGFEILAKPLHPRDLISRLRERLAA